MKTNKDKTLKNIQLLCLFIADLTNTIMYWIVGGQLDYLVPILK